MISIPLYVFVFIELCFVSYIDIKYRKIANLWTITNILISIVLFIVFPEIYPVSFDTFEFSIVFIFVGFLLFMLKIMGGGDSKFLASFFLIIPAGVQDQVFYLLLVSTVIVGGTLLIFNIISNREKLAESFKNRDVQGVKSCFGTKFAYAPVILMAWILFGINLIEKSSLLTHN